MSNAFTVRMNYDRQAVLADVDGTLLRGSLVLDHACFLHDEKVVNLGDAPDAWREDVKNEALITQLAEAYRESITGKSAVELLTRDYVKEKVADDAQFYSSIQRLRQAKEEGADVFLISGSPSFLLTPFARHFGFRSKGSLYATDTAGAFTGSIRGMFGAEAKRKHVRTLKPAQYQHITAYGDTSSDVPLFEVADHKVLVAPTQRTLSVVGAVDEVLTD